MAREHELRALPAVHPGLLLDHEVPELLAVRPVELGEGRLAPPSRHHRLTHKGSEPAQGKTTSYQLQRDVFVFFFSRKTDGALRMKAYFFSQVFWINSEP